MRRRYPYTSRLLCVCVKERQFMCVCVCACVRVLRVRVHACVQSCALGLARELNCVRVRVRVRAHGCVAEFLSVVPIDRLKRWSPTSHVPRYHMYAEPVASTCTGPGRCTAGSQCSVVAGAACRGRGGQSQRECSRSNPDVVARSASGMPATVRGARRGVRGYGSARVRNAGCVAQCVG